ncbi:MAG: protein-S-isoprenylcysteine O-methyltransferase [Pseudomonadota bacterium]
MRWIGLLVAAALLALLIWRLPVNGWGSLLWFAGVALMGVIRTPYEATSKEVSTTQSLQNGLENALLAGVAIGSGVLPALHLATGLFSFADYPVVGWWPFLGVPVVAIGLWLFWRSHADLGRNWSVTLELRDEHGLVTSGVYERIRHPMYTAIFIVYAAQAIFIHNWIAGFSGLAAFGLMYVLRVPREEAMMHEQFGEAYAAYCERTGRLLPGL